MAFSLLFNVYIRSVQVKLLQTTFSDSHPASRHPSILVRTSGSSKFLRISQTVPPSPWSARTLTSISFSFSETTSGEIRLWLMQPSFLRDQPVLAQEAGDRSRTFALVAFDASRKYSTCTTERVSALGGLFQLADMPLSCDEQSYAWFPKRYFYFICGN